MKNYQIVLASASPRRQELLKQIGFNFTVCLSKKEECVTVTEPSAVVEELSRQKAEDIFHQKRGGECPVLVIGSDTIVACDGQILGKPSDEVDACRMLAMLQGRKHEVFTGVTVFWEKKNGKYDSMTFYECTEVEFFPMSKEQIEAYVSTKEPMDKAGSYGIQGLCAAHIKGIIGDYNNVVGLPVGRLYQEMYVRDLL